MNADLCKYGHVMDETTTYIEPNGYARCRTCNNERAREYSAKRRAAKPQKLPRILHINFRGEVCIGLTRGCVSFIDGADIELACSNWTASRTLNYARRRARGGGTVYLHRLILERITGRALGSMEECDHINGNPLDNRRANLRITTRQQNAFNQRLNAANKSGYTGVYRNDTDTRWVAQIKVNTRQIYIGSYFSIEDAVAARQAAEILHFGEFAPHLSRRVE